jgi:uncharacterized LabA/DUF88 family protein
MQAHDTERVVAYIDGFTVYHGLKAKGWRHLLWLDYRALMTKLLLPRQELVTVKYFTSRVRKPEASRLRQSIYLDALAARGGIQVIEGKYESRPVKCPACDHRWPKPKEKMTDVALAIALVLDAEDDAYDVAFLLAADADLIPAVRTVHERTDKEVVVITPRGRRSDELSGTGTSDLHIRKTWFNQCQLPEIVTDDSGREYRRPEHWTLTDGVA